MIKEIYEVKEFNSILRDEKNFILYKHSTRCNVSADALYEVNRFIKDTQQDVYLVKVIESRSLSNYIEEKTGIRHESPQIFFFKNSELKSHASHFKITKSYISEQVL